MRLNRREFVRLGTLGAAGVFGTSCGQSNSPSPDSSASGRGLVRALPLQVRVKGLCIAERMPASVTVHLLDGNKVGMGAHQPLLSISKSLIDSAGTVAPSMPDPDDSGRLVFDLSGKTLTLDTGLPGPPNLEINDDPIDSTIPADDRWKSTRYAARLSTLCGATKIDDRSKFYGSLTLDHGQLQSLKPQSALGQTTIWTFTRRLPNGTDQEVAKQALTDQLLCTVQATSPTVTFMIGTQAVVLNTASAGDVLLKNLPPPGTAGVCSGTPPCVDHLEALYSLVDFKFKPTATATMSRPLGPGIEPNYCPPGSI